MSTSRDGLFAVIMAGGAGTRFWPASTEDRPKQLLTLVGDRSLLQMAVDRAAALVDHDRVLIVTSVRLEAAVRAQMPELPAKNIIAEPERRDTAAAVALATAVVQARGGTRACVLTADHLIGPTDVFVAAVDAAIAGTANNADAIVTFGVVPTHPATGFGYLEVDSADGDSARPVLRFKEKPDVDTATGYLASGRFLWNSGMFVFDTRAMARALDAHLAGHLTTLRGVVDGDGVVDSAALAAAFSTLPRISIDKGVMEKHHAVFCVPARFQWSDVGSFPSLAEHLPNDAHKNAFRGQLSVKDAERNVVWCEDDSEEVAIVGLSDIVVVRVGNKTLVVPKARAEEVKALVEGKR
jgi:mannose-1-phosphate guanylyltransferase